MSGIIREIWERRKLLLEEGIGEWGSIALVFLVALGSFGLGRLSALEDARPAVSIREAPSLASPQGIYLGGMFVASRRGSVYYYPWCSGVQKIASYDQVWYSSEASARAAGKHPAKGCKGLGE